MLLTAYLFAAEGCSPLKSMKTSCDWSLLKDKRLISDPVPDPTEAGLPEILLDREKDHQGWKFTF